MRVYFSNLGCKLNQAEIEKLSRRFLAAGHALAPALEAADLHVINTCTVTQRAARDSRKLARRGRRVNPGLRTVLTGCWATAEPRAAAALASVDLVVTNPDKDDLVDRVHEVFTEAEPAAGGVPVPYVPLTLGRARALVKIEDGCNMGCAFCIIPSTRGRQRSRPLDAVVAEVEELVAAGHPEIVVTGVQISEYADDGGRRLADLLRALLERTAVRRLRLTSIAPWKLDERLIELLQEPRVCRHVHLSLQSGSTATLRRMRRPYTADEYAGLVERLRSAVPGLAVTTDVIVGFPGETTAEFAESLALVERLAFARAHVFTYSRRPGTAAAGFPGRVGAEVKKDRVHAMLRLAEESERRFLAERAGERCDVVWEIERDGVWSGLTDHYVRVFAPSDDDLRGRLTAVELREPVVGGVRGAFP